jgi:hypothetical protein
VHAHLLGSFHIAAKMFLACVFQGITLLFKDICELSTTSNSSSFARAQTLCVMGLSEKLGMDTVVHISNSFVDEMFMRN